MLLFHGFDAASRHAKEETKEMPRNTSSMLAILKVDMFRGEGALQEMHTIHRDCMSSSRLQVITVRIGFGGMYIILWLGRNPFELCCQFSDLPPPSHFAVFLNSKLPCGGSWCFGGRVAFSMRTIRASRRRHRSCCASGWPQWGNVEDIEAMKTSNSPRMGSYILCPVHE